MNEFLQSALQMAESGDWNGIIMLLVASLTAVFASVGGIAGLITIFKILYNLVTKNKLIQKITDIIANKTKPLQEQVLEIKQELTVETKNELSNLKTDFLAKLNEIKNTYETLLINQQAFNATVLNSDALKLQYENIQNQILLANEKTKKLKEVAKIEIENVKNSIELVHDNAEQAIASVNKEIKQVVSEVETAVKNKIKKSSKKENKLSEVEYV